MSAGIPEEAFADERIASRSVATIDDYEPLLALAEERGLPLPAILAEYHASGHAEQPPRSCVRVAGRREAPIRPRGVQSLHRAATDEMKLTLGIEPE